MRIIFENLHENSFLLRSAEAIASGRKPWPAKHWNLLEYYLAHQEKIYIYINEKGSWFANGEYSFLNNEATRIAECYAICKINRIPWKRIVILREQDIMEDDILITYLFSLSNNTKNNLDKIHCYKVLDMNHFYARIPQYRLLPLFDCLVSESDIFSDSKLLKNSLYYTEHSFDVVVAPYTFRRRYVKKVPFGKRKNKAVATGTYEVLHGVRYRELRSLYHVNCLHPMRMNIYRNKEVWEEYIDCRISLWPYDEMKEDKESPKSKNFQNNQERKNKIIPKHLNQKNYYSFNMVDMYNQYKMAIVGEEIVGSPGVGFVEAMACGCAFIGLESGIYEKYGMKSGTHYIGYDGTSEDMLKKILYYQNNEKELEEIAENGYQFAQDNFNGEKVARDYFNKICSLAKKHMLRKQR